MFVTSSVSPAFRKLVYSLPRVPLRNPQVSKQIPEEVVTPNQQTWPGEGCIVGTPSSRTLWAAMHRPQKVHPWESLASIQQCPLSDKPSKRQGRKVFIPTTLPSYQDLIQEMIFLLSSKIRCQVTGLLGNICHQATDLPQSGSGTS